MSDQRRRRISLRSTVAAGIEVILAVALATAVVAALQSTAPAAGLGIVYLLAVLTVAIHRGGAAALFTSVLSVLTLNFLFITPRHRLAIAHSQDVVELTVLLIAALVVGRLAALARLRADDASSRALVAAAREREAALLANVASAILAGDHLEAQLGSVGAEIAAGLGAPEARIGLSEVAAGEQGELAIAVPSRSGRAWLYLPESASFDRAFLERVARPIGALIDIAIERREMAARVAENEAAQRAEIAKTALLHAISHDLRSPITAITTAGAALRAPGVTEPERLELLAAVATESGRLARLVDDLLDLSKIEAGAVRPQSDWCDLLDVAAVAARRFEGLHPLNLELPRDLPLVRADATQLERVLSNLIENAIKFSPPGSPVRVTGGASPAWVTVRVIDRGPGISRSDRRQIFEPFFRGRSTGSTGSGLGLAICRGFVEANGGRIAVQAAPGGGSAFAVSFPAVADPVQGPRLPAPAGAGTGLMP